MQKIFKLKDIDKNIIINDIKKWCIHFKDRKEFKNIIVFLDDVLKDYETLSFNNDTGILKTKFLIEKQPKYKNDFKKYQDLKSLIYWEISHFIFCECGRYNTLKNR